MRPITTKCCASWTRHCTSRRSTPRIPRRSSTYSGRIGMPSSSKAVVRTQQEPITKVRAPSSSPATFWPVRLFDIGQEATGVVAVGQIATGVIAIGQLATGVVAIGQISRGVVAFGQCSVGIVGAGQLGVGLVYGAGMLGFGTFAGGLIPIPLLGHLRFTDV